MVSQAQKKATTRYESKTLDKISLRLRKDGGYGVTREEIQRRAADQGLSVNEYVIKCIKEEMKK